MERNEKSIVKKVILVFLILIGVAIFAVYRFWQNGMNPVAEANEETIEIEVPLGSNRKQIGTILDENNLINSFLVYNIYTRLNEETNFKAGTYQISQSMSLEEIVNYLNDGGTPIKPEPIANLSIPEGINVEQIADRFEEYTDFSSEQFMEFMQDAEYIQKMAEKYPELLTDAVEASAQTRYTLEGYLFPATYEIFEETTLEEIIGEMLARTNQVLTPSYKEMQVGELNVHEILTLASYIEREGTTTEDRKLISGVFYNRIELGMPLQTDLSVIYALGEHKERVSLADLEVDSPYNTYMYKGLGAGPINSPSESAIIASLNPEETDYVYFLADLETGKVYFAETYDQHLEYKRKYLDNK